MYPTIASSTIFADLVFQPLRAVVSIVLRRRGYGYFGGRMATGVNGKAVFRVPRKKGTGCFRTTVARVTALGYVTWHGATPANRLCP